MLVVVGQNAVEVRTHDKDEEWRKSVWFPPYYPKTVQLGKYNHVNTFWDAAVHQHNHHAHVFASQKEVLYFRNMKWKADSVKKMFISRMSDREDAVKEVWEHLEEMLYEDIKEIHFLQKRTEFMGAGYTILESFSSLIRFSKLLKSAGLFANYGMMSLHAFMA